MSVTKESRRLQSLMLAIPLAWAGCGPTEDRDESQDAADAVESQGVAPVAGTPNGAPHDSAGTLLFDKWPTSEAASALGEFELVRLRAWRSNPPNFTPGSIATVDAVVIEVWFRLRGTGPIRIKRLGAQGGDELRATASGWLHTLDRPPGTEILSSTGYIGPNGATSFTLVEPDLLSSRRFSLAAPSGFPASMTTEGPWRVSIEHTGVLLASETYYAVNRDQSLTTPFACVVYPASGATTTQVHALPLGHLEYDPTVTNPGGSTVTTEPREADETVIAWDAEWHVVGLNVLQPALRIVRKRSAYAHNARQSPGAFPAGSTTSPITSAAENALRACNAAAGSGGFFWPLYQSKNGMLTGADFAAACPTYNNEIASPTARLDRFPSACSWGSAVRFIAHGSWDGAAHDAIPEDAATTAHRPAHVEWSEVQLIELQ